AGPAGASPATPSRVRGASCDERTGLVGRRGGIARRRRGAHARSRGPQRLWAGPTHASRPPRPPAGGFPDGPPAASRVRAAPAPPARLPDGGALRGGAPRVVGAQGAGAGRARPAERRPARPGGGVSAGGGLVAAGAQPPSRPRP